MAVRAHAPQVCAVAAPQLVGGRQTNFRGLNGTTMEIDRLVDPTTLSTNAASVDVQFNAVCNYPHRIVVEAQNNGLWQSADQGSSSTPGFASAIPYVASLSWGAETLQLDADAKARRINERSIRVDQATAGALVLRLEIQPGATNGRANSPLLAGVYGDTVRLTVEPQQ